MKKILFLLSTVTLAVFLNACGGGGSGIPRPVSGGSNNGFSNASLGGTWVFTIRGINFSSVFAVTGVFTTDGNGNIISGIEDVNDFQSGFQARVSLTGSYRVNQDGRGQAMFNFGSNSSAQFRFVFTSSGKARLFEVNNLEDATGQLLKQDTTAIASLPASSFVLRLDGFLGNNRDTVIGQLNLGGNGLTATLDENNGGTLTTELSGTGSFSIGSNGRGTATINTSNGQFNLVFYIVNSGHLEFLESDVGAEISGGADVQDSGFSTLALNGNFAFTVSGLNNSNGAPVNEVGRFTLNGAGGIGQGEEDGNTGDRLLSASPVTFIGNYSVQLNGRVTISFVNQPENYIGWLTSSQSGVLISSDANSLVKSGMFNLQTATPSTSLLNGNYGLEYAGFNWNLGANVELTGAVDFDGAGHISGLSDSQQAGVVSANSNVAGTYQIDSTGRGTGTIGGVPFVFYTVDGATAYILSSDPARQYQGSVLAQQ